VGMGSNAHGNTAVKWKRDEQCSLVTACCTCMDCKLCSLGLQMDQNLFVYALLYSLIHYARYNFELYRFKVGPFFETQCRIDPRGKSPKMCLEKTLATDIFTVFCQYVREIG